MKWLKIVQWSWFKKEKLIGSKQGCAHHSFWFLVVFKELPTDVMWTSACTLNHLSFLSLVQMLHPVFTIITLFPAFSFPGSARWFLWSYPILFLQKPLLLGWSELYIMHLHPLSLFIFLFSFSTSSVCHVFTKRRRKLDIRGNKVRGSIVNMEHHFHILCVAPLYSVQLKWHGNIEGGLKEEFHDVQGSES